MSDDKVNSWAIIAAYHAPEPELPPDTHCPHGVSLDPELNLPCRYCGHDDRDLAAAIAAIEEARDLFRGCEATSDTIANRIALWMEAVERTLLNSLPQQFGRPPEDRTPPWMR